MSNPLVQCDICQDDFTIDIFRFFGDCGHGFCTKCMDWARKQRNCPTCRHPTSDQPPCRIFLTFVEPSVTKRPLSVKEGLDLITKDTPAVSLKRAAQKMKKEAETAPKELSRSLLDSAKQLEHRLYPLASELAHERAANAALMAENDSLKSVLEETSSVQSQILDLRRRLSEAEENQRVAITLAEEATSRVVRKKEDNSRLNDTVKRYRRTLTKKDEELEALRAKLNTKENETHALKTKLRVLGKRAPPQLTQDPDDSLQVEGTGTNSQPQKKRRKKTTDG